MQTQASERSPIWRDMQTLLLEIEQAVRDFPRYHKLLPATAGHVFVTNTGAGGTGCARVVVG